MPELPEVESVVRDIRKEIIGKTIQNITVLLPRIIQNDREYFFNNVLHQKVTDVVRRGKYILILLGNHKKLVIHLRMTGALIFLPKGKKNMETHLRITFDLDDQSQLIYSDVRTFGTIQVVADLSEIQGLSSLGPEPMEDSFHWEYLYSQLIPRKGTIKSILLKQEVVAGLGNIYADESLFRAGIHPERLGNTINKKEAKRLTGEIKNTIFEALQSGGTTFRDYRNGKGEKGNFQNRLYVYGRTNLPCLQCGHPIIKTKVAGRGTHFCKYCQR